MFREMRRKDKLKTQEEAVMILNQCTNGVLSVSGDDGYPYGVPVSHVYDDGKLYFHCAGEGHKLEAIRKNPKVSFTVVGADNIAPDKFTTLYKSVVAFGKAYVIDDDARKREVLEKILSKYSSDFMESGMKYINNMWEKTYVVEIEIEHMSGKGLAK